MTNLHVSADPRHPSGLTVEKPRRKEVHKRLSRTAQATGVSTVPIFIRPNDESIRSGNVVVSQLKMHIQPHVENVHSSNERLTVKLYRRRIEHHSNIFVQIPVQPSRRSA
jgi:hypothetical protein